MDCAAARSAQPVDIPLELRSIYLALSYVICIECEQPSGSHTCGRCVTYYLVQELADLADFVDGRRTKELVDGIDVSQAIELILSRSETGSRSS